MHVAVIGAGIVGVTTAYELAVDGHRVTVFERRGTVAAESSFADAGVVAPSHVAAAAPASFFRRMLARRFGLAGAAGLGQGRRSSANGNAPTDRPQPHPLARYSQERLRRLTQALQLDFERSLGCLVLWRTARDVASAEPALASLAEVGTRFESLDAAGCRAVEPGLSADTPLAGGLWFPDDEVGNGRQFAYLLRHEAERLGVRFRFHTEVQRIEGGAEPQVTSRHLPPDEVPLHGPAADSPDTVPLAEGPRTRPFDGVVVCAALGASALLRPHGVRLPLLAVHAHSITAPLRRSELHPDLGPRSAVVDERHGVTISRLGARVRVTGSPEVGGSVDRIHPAALETLHKVLHDWFPGAAQVEHAQRWKGARPMLPGGASLLGPSGVAGLWLNVGQGSGGWGLACGSARILADQVAGRAPAIDIEAPGRFVGAPR